jgi:hypothetical protein
MPVSINLAGQPVALTISGDIAGPPWRLNLNADLADLQAHLTPLLQAELNKSDHCGERISIENARLIPAGQAGRLTVQLHFEKWACIKAFGKENAKRLVGGNGTVETIVTPRIENGEVRMDTQVTDIQADGSLGDLLRTGTIGDALRNKIRDSLTRAMQKAANPETLLPGQARAYIAIQSLAFADEGEGRLGMRIGAQLQIPDAQISSLLEQFRTRK